MAYQTAQLRLMVPALDGQGNNWWGYSTADAQGTVAAAGYFSDGKLKGMRVGDLVIVNVTGTPTNYSFTVLSFTGNAANLSAGTALN